MNLERFSREFRVTSDESRASPAALPPSTSKDIRELISMHGGKSFEHGLYRVLGAGQVAESTEAMERVFPELRGRIEPFGFDWLGRHFVLDRARVVNGSAQILMLEVGAGEAMQIPASLTDFHNIELTEYADDALAAQFWRRWRELYPADLVHSACVGYKVPLFLGGEDDLDNLEVIDLSVYVELCGQLRNKIRTLSHGLKISQISLKD